MSIPDPVRLGGPPGPKREDEDDELVLRSDSEEEGDVGGCLPSKAESPTGPLSSAGRCGGMEGNDMLGGRLPVLTVGSSMGSRESRPDSEVCLVRRAESLTVSIPELLRGGPSPGVAGGCREGDVTLIRLGTLLGGVKGGGLEGGVLSGS